MATGNNLFSKSGQDGQDLLNTVQGGQSLTPQQFASYIYQGAPEDHAAATQRGLEYLQQSGLAPQAGVNLWNQALGTQFTLDDYYRVTGQQPPVTQIDQSTAQQPNTFTQQAAQPSYNEMFVDALYSNIFGQPLDTTTRSQFIGDLESRKYTTQQLADLLYQQRYAPPPVTADATKAATNDAAAAAASIGTTTPQTGSADWFKQYIYQGGADDATATQRGLDWAKQQGLTPVQTVNLWNQSLGTDFTAKDFYDATGIDLPKAPNAPPEGQMPNLSFFGREGGWDLASGAFVDPTRGRVYEPPSGVVFQRGNEVIVGDELFWSPYAPTGDKLKGLVQQNQANGYRVGTVVSPYATLVGSQEGKEPPVTIKQLAQEVANSGVDFVAIDPYVGWFDIKSEDLVNWSKQFLDEMRALGKDTILVMQNDVPGANTKEEVFAHNRSLMNIPGFSEYVAYSEMPDEKDRLSGFFDDVYARLDRSEGKKNAGKPPEDRKVALNESTPPIRLAYGGGIGSLAYRMKR